MRLADQIPHIIQKLILELVREEVVPDHLLCETELPLCRLEIELDIILLEEGRRRVGGLVLLCLTSSPIA
jgi:hypothetical protein